MIRARFRLALKSLAVAALLGVSGCVTTEMGARHLMPIPASLVAEMSAKGMSPADPMFVRIFKKESELEVWKRDRSGQYALLKTYPMCRWSGQLGPKTREGDRQAPEGFYTVTPELMNPRSQFHLSFNLGYPNALERSQGFSGSALMVHGACTSAGCFAMTDDGVSEIYALAREAFVGGQKSFQVQALPFRMTPENMAVHRDNKHFAFWKNLKEGSDHFEATKQPPRIASCGRRYVFNPADGSGSYEAGEACPPYRPDPAVAEAVTRKRSADDQRFAEVVKAGMPAMSFAHVDGGMHKDFRAMLASMGADRLQAMTSGRVEISRPAAALADPFDAAKMPKVDLPAPVRKD